MCPEAVRRPAGHKCRAENNLAAGLGDGRKDDVDGWTQRCNGMRCVPNGIVAGSTDRAMRRASCFRSEHMATSDKSSLAPVGAAAPDFALHSTPDQVVQLADFRGRPVVI